MNEQLLSALEADLHETRGEVHLLVWGASGQWLAVDQEFYELLKAFDGKTPLPSIIRGLARRGRRAPSELERELVPLVKDLQKRGILTHSGTAPELPEESISIANITLNLTNRCNLACAFCYNQGHHSAEAPVSEILDGLRRGASVIEKNSSLIILGGEPTLDSTRLLALLDGAEELFTSRPTLSTNGTLLHRALVRALASRRVEVQVSLDSADASRHDAIRGPGVHARAIEGVRRLVDSGLPVILSMVYHRDNLADLEPYLDLALALGVQEARFIPMRAIGAGHALRERLPDPWKAWSVLSEILRRRPELRRLLVRDWFSIAMVQLRAQGRRTQCGIGRRVVFIDADASVFPCPNHVAPAFKAGNLATEDLGSILHDSPLMRGIRERYHVQRYPSCRGCAFRSWCAGDCRGEVLSLCGDPSGESPHCAALKRVYTDMLWSLVEDSSALDAPARLADGRSALDASFV